MRVLFVGAHIAKGGGQALQTLQLFRELQHSVDGTLICLDTPGIHRVETDDPNIHTVGKLVMPQGIFDLARSLRAARGSYDLVQLLDAYYALPASYLARSFPRAILLGIDPIIEVGDMYGPGLRWSAALGLPVLLRDTHVIVNAHSLTEAYRRYHPTVIENGVDLARFDRLPERTAARAELGLPINGPVLLLVCKVVPVKRVEWFLEVVRRIPEAHGVVVGGYDEERWASAYFHQLQVDSRDIRDRVTFVGEVRFEQVTRYLAAADVFVFPSRFEGRPNAIDEAMAAKLPVVASDIPAHREMIVSGRNGYLAPDVEGLTEATRKLLGDASLRRQIGEAGAQYIRENFSVAREAEKFLALYRRILGGELPGSGPESAP
ncbi:MAG: glycosyltransferase family 4 protein [Thermoplasmata archaeon]